MSFRNSLFFLLTISSLTLFAKNGEPNGLLKSLESQSGEERVVTLNAISKEYIKSKNFKSALRHIEESIMLAKALNFESGFAAALDNKGQIFETRFDYTNAMVHYVESLKIQQKNNNQVGIAQSKNNIGKLFFLQEDYTSALDNLNQALSIIKPTAENQLKSDIYFNIGNVYLAKKTYGDATQNFNAAMSLMIKNKQYKDASMLSNMMGDIEKELGRYDEALVYYQKAYDIDSSVNDVASLAGDQSNIAMIYLAQSAYEEAIEANEMVFRMCAASNDEVCKARAYLNEGRIYAAANKKTAANKSLSSCSNIMKTLTIGPGTKDIYESLSATYAKLGDFKNAYSFNQLYVKNKEVLFNEDKSRALLELTTKYESEFEAETQKQTIYTLEKEKVHSKNIRYFLMAIIGLIGMLSMVLLKSYKNKKRDNALLQEKNDKIGYQKEEIKKKNSQLEETNSQLDLLNGKLVGEMAERESIEQVSFARDTFLAAMSQEMRTPINMITGTSHLLMKEEPRTDQVEHLRTLQFAANDLVVFINDILDFSKIEAGKLNISSRPFNPINTFNEIEDRFKVLTKDKNVNFSMELNENVPENIIGDPIRLNQVMTNLIGNSFDNTEEGTIDVKVEVMHETSSESTFKIVIEDTGQGMSKEQIDRIFKQMKKGESTENNFEGYDTATMGLFIAKRLVELQNGKIEMNSYQGKQTVVTVYLPFKNVNTKFAKKMISPEMLSSSGHRILVVEDNKINQIVVAKMLTKIGMQVVTANNGIEALNEIKAQNFDLILMDIQMPKMDGYRATAEIRKMADPMKRDVPIIALTASAFLTEKEKAKLFGMNDHVGKPFSPEDLMEKIKMCLAVYHK